MIFFTVGTSPHPFDRLVAAADDLARCGEEVFVQYGTSRVRPYAATAIDFLPFAALELRVREARVVVSHAGVGSVGLCLRHGKKPILVPRRRDVGEQIDDHQLAFSRRVEGLGLAVSIEDIRDLPAAVATADTALPHPTGLSEELADELVTYIRQAVTDRDERKRPGAAVG